MILTLKIAYIIFIVVWITSTIITDKPFQLFKYMFSFITIPYHYIKANLEERKLQKDKEILDSQEYSNRENMKQKTKKEAEAKIRKTKSQKDYIFDILKKSKNIQNKGG